MKQSEALKHFKEEYAPVLNLERHEFIKVAPADLRRLFEAKPDFDVNETYVILCALLAMVESGRSTMTQENWERAHNLLREFTKKVEGSIKHPFIREILKQSTYGDRYERDEKPEPGPQ
jgi:hypothetical protein